jgi:hypothetical protein
MDQSTLERLGLQLLQSAVPKVFSNPPPDDELAVLRREVEEAKRKRSRLLQNAVASQRSYSVTSVGNLVQRRQNPLVKESDAPVHNTVLRRAKLVKLGERLSSYRFTGVSCFSVGGRPLDLGFRFDSTYGVGLFSCFLILLYLPDIIEYDF